MTREENKIYIVKLNIGYHSHVQFVRFCMLHEINYTIEGIDSYGVNEDEFILLGLHFGSKIQLSGEQKRLFRVNGIDPMVVDMKKFAKLCEDLDD